MGSNLAQKRDDQHIRISSYWPGQGLGSTHVQVSNGLYCVNMACFNFVATMFRVVSCRPVYLNRPCCFVLCRAIYLNRVVSYLLIYLIVPYRAMSFFNRVMPCAPFIKRNVFVYSVMFDSYFSSHKKVLKVFFYLTNEAKMLCFTIFTVN